MTLTTDPDIPGLRSAAAERAAARPRIAFDGTVSDRRLETVAVRWYRPASSAAEPGIVFLHGGYGVLGDLELQDAYCRRIAGILRLRVLSVDYRLAPEAVLADSADDVLAAVGALRASGAGRVVLWGDSAGGALALAVARRADAAALVLSNPNVDLSLGGFDDAAPGGPDRMLSEWAFARWAGGGHLRDAPDLAADPRGLPPVFAAVGSDDSLLADARRLVHRCRDAGGRAELRVVAGASHGFMGGPDIAAAEGVIRAAGAFIDEAARPVG